MKRERVLTVGVYASEQILTQVHLIEGCHDRYLFARFKHHIGIIVAKQGSPLPTRTRTQTSFGHLEVTSFARVASHAHYTPHIIKGFPLL